MTKGIAVSTSKVRVATARYEHEHGKKPGGNGYWRFRICGNWMREFTYTGLYSKAKRNAQRRTAARGFYDIEVLP